MRSTDAKDSGDELGALFARAISALTQGGLLFPAPFDLATAAALAANDDTGTLAEKVFDLAASRDTGYRVAIYATAPGVADREVVDTSVDSTQLLITLLDGVLEELLEVDN